MNFLLILAMRKVEICIHARHLLFSLLNKSAVVIADCSVSPVLCGSVDAPAYQGVCHPDRDHDMAAEEMLHNNSSVSLTICHLKLVGLQLMALCLHSSSPSTQSSSSRAKFCTMVYRYCRYS